MIPFYALGSFVVVTEETYPGKRGYFSDSMTAIIVGFDSFSGLYTLRPTVGRARGRGGVEECGLSLACVSGLSFLEQNGKPSGPGGQALGKKNELGGIEEQGGEGGGGGGGRRGGVTEPVVSL